MKTLLCLFGLILGSATSAETLQLCTGEFEPYAGQHLPEQGISSVAVKTVLEKAGYKMKIEFLPWRRAYANLKSGKCQASYPWALNDERQKDILYSDPLHKDQIAFFVRRNSVEENPRSWQGKTLCIPSGWDLKQIENLTQKYQFKLIRPPELQNCMQMTSLSRADLTAVNQMVGNILIAKTFPGPTPPLVQVSEETTRDFTYFVVSRKYTKAQELIEKFNATLKKLTQDGSYDHLIRAAVEKQKSH